jgi:DNA-binding NarL/FixJ family response regulator
MMTAIWLERRELGMTARILIVDDHEIVREGIRMLISRSRPEWEICGEAANGSDAVEAIKNLKPDVVVLDITMPGLSGLEVASQVTKLDLGSRVLMFTMHESEMLHGEVRRTGAQGYVLKSQAARDLIRAIDTLLAGGSFFDGPQSVSTGPGNDRERGPGKPGFGMVPNRRHRVRRSVCAHARCSPVRRKSPFSSPCGQAYSARNFWGTSFAARRAG